MREREIQIERGERQIEKESDRKRKRDTERESDRDIEERG